VESPLNNFKTFNLSVDVLKTKPPCDFFTFNPVFNKILKLSLENKKGTTPKCSVCSESTNSNLLNSFRSKVIRPFRANEYKLLSWYFKKSSISALTIDNCSTFEFSLRRIPSSIAR